MNEQAFDKTMSKCLHKNRRVRSKLRMIIKKLSWLSIYHYHRSAEAYQDEELGVMLVGKRWERNWTEFSAFKPMYSCGVNCHCFFWRYIRPILQVIVLPLLFCLQIQSGQPTRSQASIRYQSRQLLFQGMFSQVKVIWTPAQTYWVIPVCFSKQNKRIFQWMLSEISELAGIQHSTSMSSWQIISFPVSGSEDVLKSRSCIPSKIFAAYSLVYGSTSSDSLSIVVSHIGPPVSLLLHIPQDHILNRCRQTWHLPWDVCLQEKRQLTWWTAWSVWLVMLDISMCNESH